jgi:hypothetical protein
MNVILWFIGLFENPVDRQHLMNNVHNIPDVPNVHNIRIAAIIEQP